ncbi:MAG: hypothetical protein Greene041619_89 [Candidatus Peregrinibacteria bacterium Greene0416_19]|nr:MAG: hypothetical protein Greene041619_89 [Candidatus Peregrinibacteria bacterium Greene0416_19]
MMIFRMPHRVHASIDLFYGTGCDSRIEPFTPQRLRVRGCS